MGVKDEICRMSLRNEFPKTFTELELLEFLEPMQTEYEAEIEEYKEMALASEALSEECETLKEKIEDFKQKLKLAGELVAAINKESEND